MRTGLKKNTLFGRLTRTSLEPADEAAAFLWRRFGLISEAVDFRRFEPVARQNGKIVKIDHAVAVDVGPSRGKRTGNIADKNDAIFTPYRRPV
jgi:hypothetical protein